MHWPKQKVKTKDLMNKTFLRIFNIDKHVITKKGGGVW